MPFQTDYASRRRLIPPFAALVCAAVIAALTLSAPAPAAAATTCSLSSMSSSSQPACWRPFASTSVFNTPLNSSPTLDPNSSAIINRMVSSGLSIDGSKSSFSLHPEFYGTRNVFFASPSDPTMRIACKTHASLCTGANRVNIVGTSIHVPAGAKPYANGDAHMTVIETATGNEYDFWQTSISGSTISAAAAAEVNVNTGNGLGSEGDAAQFGLTAGLVRPSELAAGQINHALVVSVPCTNGSGHTAGFTFPAVQGDGAPCGPNGSAANANAPVLGQLLRLNMSDAQIQASPAPAWQKAIMTALAHYGAYVEDTGGRYPEIDIFSQAGSSFTDLGQPNPWAKLGSLTSSTPILISNFQVVSPCVPEGKCSGVAAAAPGASSTQGDRHKRDHRSHQQHKRHHRSHRHHTRHHSGHRHHKRHHHRHRHHKHHHAKHHHHHHHHRHHRHRH